MNTATTGIEVRARSAWVRDAVELVSSMRFSISLLSVICIASVIGTVVRQHDPFPNYVNQFGPFWAQVLDAAGLYTVYSTWWFLLILGVLVVSTSLCIARNAPKIVADLRSYKEHVREQALAAFHHKGQAELAETPEAAFERISKLLVVAGWKAKVDRRSHGTMIAARRGAANRLGYLAAHSAIVLICLGGLFDGDLIVRAQMALQGKRTYAGGGLLKDVTADHRLGPNTPTFRANLLVPEGARAGTAVINLQDGVVLQDLPFDIELQKFIVEYYATGMPKLFASRIVIHDHDTGAAIPATVEVNKPAFHRGVAIYQSSFDDGGSELKMRAWPMGTQGQPFDIAGVVGNATRLGNGQDALTLEFTGFRAINVENLAGSGTGSATDVRKVDLKGALDAHLGSGIKVRDKRELHNIGPSVSYKLRDAAGQAHEFNNYMQPVTLDGQRVYLVGARDKPDDAMRYLRIPADDQDGMQGWMRLHAALFDADLRNKAVARYVAKATPPDKPEMAKQLEATAGRALALFAGAEPVQAGKKPVGGLQAISDFMELSVPVADRTRISDVLLRILDGSLFELLNLSREQQGLAPLAADDKTQAFMTQSVLALSDSFFYPAPVLLQLTDYRQVQASVFQVARAPGKTLVYLGAALLIIGVFAMLYVRERRLWIWIAPALADGSKVTTALSTTRRTLDADAEFERLKEAILAAPRAEPLPP
ncbi:MAG: cytochrome c biogenesis protein ResB [Proteobacteria bacterium]|nr:cytochrome c biogenesis protein ResB [Pseudomonadota bacterium]